MIASLRILTTGATPLSLSEAKSHLRIDHNADDGMVTAYLNAAFTMFEKRTGRCYRPVTATLYRDCFPDDDDPICLPLPPLMSVTGSITYTKPDLTAGTILAAAFEVLTAPVPGEVIPVANTSWPVALDRRGSVVVTFAAGDVTKCPDVVLDAARLYIDHAYHEHGWLESKRIAERIDSLLASELLRDPNLIGIRT